MKRLFTIEDFKAGLHLKNVPEGEKYSVRTRGGSRVDKISASLNGHLIIYRRGTDLIVVYNDGKYFQNKYNSWDLLIDIPDEKKDNDYEALRKAADALYHLHLSEMEGLRSGMPTREQWFKAVNDLGDLLYPKG